MIFAFTDAQRAAAQASKERLQASGELAAPVVTEIVPAGKFTKAEDYHQQYVEKGGVAYCHVRRHRAAAAPPPRPRKTKAHKNGRVRVAHRPPTGSWLQGPDSKDASQPPDTCASAVASVMAGQRAA